jgi:hypothetical protein
MRRLIPMLWTVLALAAAGEVRVAPFRVGATDINETSAGVVTRGDTFAVLTLRSAPVAGAPATIRYTPIGSVGMARTILSSPKLSFARAAESTLLWVDDSTLFLASLSDTGEVGEPRSFGKTNGPAALGCNGSRCTVAWYDLSSRKTMAAITDTAGNPLIAGIALPMEGSPASVVSDPNGFLILDTFGGMTRVDRNTGAVTFNIANHAVAADFDGHDYVAVFTVFESNNNREYVMRVSTDGKTTVPKPIGPAGDFLITRIAWNGAQHLIAHVINDTDPPGVGRVPEVFFASNIFVSHLNALLDPIDAAPLQVTNNKQCNVVRDLAWNGSSYYLAYDDLRTDTNFGFPFEARGALLTPAGGVVKNEVIAIGPMSQTSPALASSGDVRLAAWLEQDRATGITALRSARVTRDGRQLDAHPWTLVEAKSITLQNASIAAVSGDFLVVWSEERFGGQSAGAIIDAGGSLHRLSLPLQSYGSAARVASNGSSWIVIGFDVRRNLSAVRVSRSGQVLTPQLIPIGTLSGGFDVASDGDRFGIVRGLDSGRSVLTVLDANGAVVTADQPVADRGAVSIGGDRSGFLVAAGAPTIIQRFDRDGRGVGQPLKLPSAVGFTDIQPFGAGWALSYEGFTTNRLMLIDAAATRIIDAINIDRSSQAFASNDDRTLSVLFARAEELESYGAGIAQFVRELAAPPPPRRHAAR